MDKKNKQIIGVSVFIAIVIGFAASDIARFLGMKRSVGEKGGMIRITGNCQTRSGGQVVLTNDTVRLIKETENEIEAVLISDAKYLRCNLANIYVESFSVLDLFNKRKIQVETSKTTREVERDPIMDNLKKTVLISGFCKVKDSEVMLNDKVMDVLDIKETDNGFETIGLVKSLGKEVKCLASRSKMNPIAESDVQAFLDKEKGSKEEARSFKGRTISVTGICLKRIEGKSSKNQIVDVSSQPVKVTEEVVINGVVQKIYGKSRDENQQIISVECSREFDKGLLFEEISAESEKTDSVGEGIKTVAPILNMKITGKCKGSDNNYVELYEQVVKVVSSEKDPKNGKTVRAVVKVKNEDGTINTLTCDKSMNVIFEVIEQN